MSQVIWESPRLSQQCSWGCHWVIPSPVPWPHFLITGWVTILQQRTGCNLLSAVASFIPLNSLVSLGCDLLRPLSQLTLTCSFRLKWEHTLNTWSRPLCAGVFLECSLWSCNVVRNSKLVFHRGLDSVCHIAVHSALHVLSQTLIQKSSGCWCVWVTGVQRLLWCVMPSELCLTAHVFSPFAVLLKLWSHHSWYLTDSISASKCPSTSCTSFQPRLLYLYTQQFNKELLSEEHFYYY